MKVSKIGKHKKSEKHDGHRSEIVKKRSNKQTPPRYENFDGEPTE